MFIVAGLFHDPAQPRRGGMVSTVRGYAALMEVGKIFLMVGGLWGGRNMAIVAVALGTPHKIRTRMNKLMAILFALGALAGFGLSQSDRYNTRNQTTFGTPVGPERTVYLTRRDRIAYTAFGISCAIGCLYFIARIRRDDLRG